MSYPKIKALQLQQQPVLRTDLLDELHCALAPVEVFLLVLQVSLQQVVGGGIILYTLHALHQQLNAWLLNGVCLQLHWQKVAIPTCFLIAPA